MKPNIFIFLILLLLTAMTIGLDANESSAQSKYSIGSLQWNIEFSMESLEEIAQKPEVILKDIEAFWNKDKTLKVVALWHELRHFPVDYERMKRNLERLAEISIEQRLSLPSYRLAKRLIQEKKEFCSKAIPHLCSFLPNNGSEFNTIVYFTSAIDQNGFAVTTGKTHVVINTADPYWRESYSWIQNALVHELFHAGFNSNYFLFRNEIELENRNLYDLISRLQNEGLATYVAYTAQALFSAPTELDFQLMNKRTEVKSRFKKLNKLFRKADSYLDERLLREAWEIGVEDRAFYIVGAHMARKIDEKRGRDVLVETITQGPRAFVSLYNLLAERGMEVFEFKSPLESESIYRKMRMSVFKKDYKTFRRLFNKLENKGESPIRNVEYTLNRIGGLLMHQDEAELAEEIFRLNLKYYPKSLGAHSGLGDAHLKRGDIDAAIEVYEKILELDPLNLDLEDEINELKRMEQ